MEYLTKQQVERVLIVKSKLHAEEFLDLLRNHLGLLNQDLRLETLELIKALLKFNDNVRDHA